VADPESLNIKIELTERGQHYLPRALEIGEELSRLPFWACLALAEREYDTQEFTEALEHNG